jgi:hypothetical protein
MIAPLVAADDKGIAFVVLLAGPGVPGADIIVRQAVLIAKAGGVEHQDIERDQRKLVDLVLQHKDRAALAKAVQAHLEDVGQRTGQKMSPEQLEATVESLHSPWYRAFLAFDPGPVLARVKCPVLHCFFLSAWKDRHAHPDQRSSIEQVCH